MFRHSDSYYLAHFSPARLTFARQLRGMRKKDLGESIGRTAAAVTQYESGKALPSMETLQAIMSALRLPAAFFCDDSGSLPNAPLEGVHFRSNIDVPKIVRQKACNYGRLVNMVYGCLEWLGVKFPEPALPKLESPQLESGIEELAVAVRHQLGLGLGPIHDLADLLESLGVRLIFLPPDDSYRLDAFATWLDGRPCMILDSGVPPSRLQFNYAHELSHLVFDEEKPGNDRGIERKAHRFAGAFLMPRETFELECPRSYKNGNWLAIKRHWHVSIAAALYRGRQLGIVSEKVYRNACIQRTIRSLRDREEGEFEPSLPTLLNQAMRLVSDHVNLEDLSNRIGIHLEELEELLAMQGVEEGVIEKMRPARPKAQILAFRPEKIRKTEK